MNEADLKRFADELVERQRTVHERVDCPYCFATVGERCRSMQKPFSEPRVLTKHPHIERLRANGIYPR